MWTNYYFAPRYFAPTYFPGGVEDDTPGGGVILHEYGFGRELQPKPRPKKPTPPKRPTPIVGQITLRCTLPVVKVTLDWTEWLADPQRSHVTLFAEMPTAEAKLLAKGTQARQQTTHRMFAELPPIEARLRTTGVQSPRAELLTLVKMGLLPVDVL